MGLCVSPHLLKVVLLISSRVTQDRDDQEVTFVKSSCGKPRPIPERSGCRCSCETLADQGADKSDSAGCKPCHLAHWTVLLALTSGTHEICRALTTGRAAISPESIFEKRADLLVRS